MQEIIFETTNLTKKYPNTLALDKVSISIKQGEIYGFIGENGAGKTTLIRILTGLAKPTSGEMSLWGKKGKLLNEQRSRMGCIVESPSVYMNMTARQNLEIQRQQRGIPGKTIIETTLDMVKLSDTGNKKAKDFSLGMRQRLALAIALLGNPEFLILDEPINGLDPSGIIELRNLLKQLNCEKGITIFISSHILSELHQLATNYGIMHKGKLVQQITASELEENCKQHLFLQVDDVAAATRIIETELHTSHYVVMPDKSIRLYECNDNAGRVSSLMSQNGIILYQMAQGGDDLETYYTKLIGGDTI